MYGKALRLCIMTQKNRIQKILTSLCTMKSERNLFASRSFMLMSCHIACVGLC